MNVSIRGCGEESPISTQALSSFSFNSSSWYQPRSMFNMQASHYVCYQEWIYNKGVELVLGSMRFWGSPVSAQGYGHNMTDIWYDLQIRSCSVIILLPEILTHESAWRCMISGFKLQHCLFDNSTLSVHYGWYQLIESFCIQVSAPQFEQVLNLMFLAATCVQWLTVCAQNSQHTNTTFVFMCTELFVCGIESTCFHTWFTL